VSIIQIWGLDKFCPFCQFSKTLHSVRFKKAWKSFRKYCKMKKRSLVWFSWRLLETTRKVYWKFEYHSKNPENYKTIMKNAWNGCAHFEIRTEISTEKSKEIISWSKEMCTYDLQSTSKQILNHLTDLVWPLYLTIWTLPSWKDMKVSYSWKDYSLWGQNGTKMGVNIQKRDEKPHSLFI